ncbi:MAG: CsbD family protein [Burkholderiales bacterium]
MNKNQIKGAARDFVGKAQQEAGKLLGSKKQQVKGLEKQISGRLQKGVGDAAEAIRNVTKRGPGNRRQSH